MNERDSVDRLEFPHMRSVILDLIRRCEPPNQTAFAARVGTTQSTVSDWVRGVIPHRSTRLRICDAMGVEIEDFEAKARGRRLDPDAPVAKATDRTFPLVNVAPAGRTGWHCELGPTTQDAPDRVSAPWLPADPEIFAVRIAGDSMEPPLVDGWIAFFRWCDPHVDGPRPIEDGTMVYVCFTADSAHPEECCIASWSFDPDAGAVTLTKTARKFSKWRETFPPEHVRQVAVFVGMMPRLV